MRFEFATATRVLFGAGTLRELGKLASDMVTVTVTVMVSGDRSRRALVTTGRSTERVRTLTGLLEGQGISCSTLNVAREPTIELVQEGTRLARDERCGLVIGFGGGSAIDAGKAIAAMLTNPGEVLDYLEVIGGGRTLSVPPVPYIAIPTTAGTGAEVTRNAVLASPEHKVKVSMRSPLMLPRLALVDPELTYDLPPAVTASTGMDALTQLIEPYVSVRANPMTDAVCREGIRRAARSLLRACRDGRDAAAREDMSIASLFGGLALANAGLGAAHGFAGPIGGEFPAPHGAVCATLLPHVMSVNVRALRERAPTSPALMRYAEVAALLTDDASATAERGIDFVRQLCEELAIAPLGAYGVTTAALSPLVEKGRAASSMKGNPIALTDAELYEIVSRAL
jgi:alcohol dehydrogenase class IV